MADILPFIDINNPEEQGAFVLQNLIAHQTLAEIAIDTLGISTFDSPLDLDPASPQDWLLDHYQIHVSQARAFGIDAPPDLSTLDLKNKGAVADWELAHAEHHQLLNTAAGLP